MAPFAYQAFKSDENTPAYHEDNVHPYWHHYQYSTQLFLTIYPARHASRLWPNLTQLILSFFGFWFLPEEQELVINRAWRYHDFDLKVDTETILY